MILIPIWMIVSLSLIGLSLGLYVVKHLYQQHMQKKMQDEVRNILCEYLPLEEFEAQTEARKTRTVISVTSGRDRGRAGSNRDRGVLRPSGSRSSSQFNDYTYSNTSSNTSPNKVENGLIPGGLTDSDVLEAHDVAVVV
mmetsp:Transcript_17001/g.16349  ORF Transcript_17001/g.16349 Transcript_17001/m.16349 type:complete len:139 (+) Transcript_17001:99-515(+)